MSSHFEFWIISRLAEMDIKPEETHKGEDSIDFYVEKCNDCISQLKNVIQQQTLDQVTKHTRQQSPNKILEVIDACFTGYPRSYFSPMKGYTLNTSIQSDQNKPPEQTVQSDIRIEEIKLQYEEEIKILQADLQKQTEIHSQVVSDYEERIKELKLENVSLQMKLTETSDTKGFSSHTIPEEQLDEEWDAVDAHASEVLYQNTFDQTPEEKFHTEPLKKSSPQRRATISNVPSVPSVDTDSKKRFSLSSTESSELQYLDSMSDFQAEKELKKAMDSLEMRKGPGNDWKGRVQAMKVIAKLVRKPELTDLCAKEFSNLRPKLLDQLKDLRSAVIRAACSVLIVYSEEFGNRFQNNVIYFLPALFQGLFVTIKAISIACHECICRMIDNTKGTKFIGKILLGMDDTHNAVRQRCAEYLGMILEYCTPEDENFQTNSSILYISLLKALQDSDPQVRKHSRECFFKFRELDPVAASDLYDCAPPAVRKYIS